MNLTTILSMLKSIVPVLEPLGEQGITQLFVTIDAQIAAMPQSDLKDAAVVFSPAFKAFALLEVKKLNGGT